MAKRRGRSTKESTRLRGGSYKLPFGGNNSKTYTAATYRNALYTRTGNYGGPKALRTPEYKEFRQHTRNAGVGSAISTLGWAAAGFGPPPLLKPGAAIALGGTEAARGQLKKAEYAVDKATGTKKSLFGGYYEPAGGVVDKSFTQKHPHFISAVASSGAGALLTTYKTRDQFGRTRYGNFAYDKAFNKLGHWSEDVAAKRAARSVGPLSDSLEIDIRRPVRVENLASHYARPASIARYVGSSSPSRTNTALKVAGIGAATATVGYGGYKVYQNRARIKNKFEDAFNKSKKATMVGG